MTALENELRAELLRIEQQRRAIIDDLTKENIGLPEQWRYQDGTYVMVPLIVARSNVLLGLAMLKGKT